MRKVVAALDNSLAASPVLMTSLALGRILDARVEAVHVSVDGDRVARSAASALQVPLQTASGQVVERLIEIGQASDVVALVVGARGSPFGGRPLGGTALAVATSLSSPLVVVPPAARQPGHLRRVLVPLEGKETESHTPRAIVELARGEQLDVVVLHVLEEESLPLFSDQPQHEQAATTEEFLRRHCPWGIGKVRRRGSRRPVRRARPGHSRGAGRGHHRARLGAGTRGRPSTGRTRGARDGGNPDHARARRLGPRGRSRGIGAGGGTEGLMREPT